MTPEQAQDALEFHRQEVDRIDLRILSLMNERARVVEKIGDIKRLAALPIYEPKREELVFRNVIENNPGPLSEAAVRRLFERVIDEMRTLQRERMKQRERQS